jgi:hypothetical protein
VVQELFKARWLEHPCYDFVHDDERFKIAEGRMDKDDWVAWTSTIRPRESQVSILSHVPAILHAHEVHVIDSCFMHLIESIDLINAGQRLVYHRYARPVREDLYGDGRWSDVDCPTRKNWEVLN